MVFHLNVFLPLYFNGLPTLIAIVIIIIVFLNVHGGKDPEG